jgi:hypothetical protein
MCCRKKRTEPPPTLGSMEYPDGAFRVVVRTKILHYHQLYINRPDPISFMSVVVDTSDHIYDDFSRSLFLHAHHEASTLTNEIPEESDQFCFLNTTSLSNLKGSVGLILKKTSTMRILYHLICRLGLLFHYRVSFVRDVLFHF